MPLKRIIVFGNEKGGTGKSTLAVHLTVKLLNSGYKVGTIDVDAAQGTLSRYLENRLKTKMECEDANIKMPVHTPMFFTVGANTEEIETNNQKKFEWIIESYSNLDYVIIDTPGSDNSLSRIAHSYADTLVTPLNESFIDLDLLVKLKESVSGEQLKPSTYSEMVWEQKKRKAARNRGTIDWMVLVNRMAHMSSKNRQELEKILDGLSKRIGFRLCNGFKERVIFRELFISGLTILDKSVKEKSVSISHIAARQEMDEFVDYLFRGGIRQ
jgi:chromosome partitioning protein